MELASAIDLQNGAIHGCAGGFLSVRNWQNAACMPVVSMLARMIRTSALSETGLNP